MPKKIRELKKILEKAGFSKRPGKGSHSNWTHPLYPGRITIAGKDGADAKPYQESEIMEAIKIVKNQQKRREENE
jgi:predicted RNA binding protein YcfA (HicA-like mRNA interferase family)